MARPRRCRFVMFQPTVAYFKPAGVALAQLSEVALGMDELEALRLVDYLGLTQEEAASRMAVSQPTMHRLLIEARKKIVDALVNGKAIRISQPEWIKIMQKAIGKPLGRRARRRFGRM